MSDTNFGKAEDLFGEGARKIHDAKMQRRLNKEIDETQRNARKRIKNEPPRLEAVEKVLMAMAADLKIIKKIDEDVFADLYDVRLTAKELSKKADSLTYEEWEELLTLKDETRNFREELFADSESEYNEELIKEEQDRLKKKGKYYFRIREEWDTI